MQIILGGGDNDASYKIILFDLDDTLIHFEDYWQDSLIETFRRHKSTRDFDVDSLLEVLLSHNSIFEVMYHNQEITIDQFRNFRLIHSLAEFDSNIDEETAIDFNMLHKSMSKLFMKSDPILKEFLLDLKRSYLLGIVTNGTTIWQQDKIDAMGIRSLFASDAIIISEEVGFDKPSPEIYHKALSIFHVVAEETLFVGDSWANDIEGPGNVGIRSIWFNKKREERRKHPKLLGEISELQELKRYL